MKALMRPMAGLHHMLVGALRGDPTVPLTATVNEVARGENNTVRAHITVAPKERKIGDVEAKDMDMILSFAPEMGYAIVEEIGEYGGKRVSTVRRVVKKYGDAWFLEKYDMRSGEDQTENMLRVKVEVIDFEPNVEIDDETFEISGLGIPTDNTRVWDRETGANYKYVPVDKPETEVDREPDSQRQDRPKQAIEAEGIPGTDSGTPGHAVHPISATPDMEGLVAGEEQDDHSAGRGGHWTLAVVLLALLIIVISVLIARRRRPRA